MSDLEDIANAASQAPATSDIKDIQAVATRMLDAQAEVAEIEDRLKDAKARLRGLQEGKLPELMEAVGITEFKLKNGMTVSVVEDLKVSVPKKNKAKVCDIMKEWGYEGAVNTDFIAPLGKGSDNVAKSLMQSAHEMGVEANIIEDIATATVKKALRERMGKGLQDDFTLFGAFRFVKATVK